jgi:hypothetical protein
LTRSTPSSSKVRFSPDPLSKIQSLSH